MQHTNKKIKGLKIHNTLMQRIKNFQLFIIVKSNAPLKKKKKKMVGTWVHSLVPKQLRGLGGGGRVAPNLKE
jgi:hypothetical protein